MVPSTPLALRVPLLRLLRVLAGAALIPATLSAQATQTVPPDHPVYAFIDRLVAARLVDAVIVGQRPMSRREVGRIIGEARTRAGERGWFAERIRDYGEAFPPSLRRASPTQLLELDAIAMDSPSRPIEPDANGAIDVMLNPLSSNRLGRPVADGQTMSYRVAVGQGVTQWFAVAMDARTNWLRGAPAPTRRSSRFDQLYARALWRDVSLTVGRDHNFLGQGNSAGLMSSVNPRSTDQIRVASDRPFTLPSVLRHAGPMQASVVLGNLGDSQWFPNTRFFAYKVSARPHRRFEIGTGLAEQVGGSGSPPGTFLQKATDAFPLLDALFLHRNTLFSNKFVDVDLRYTIPGLRGAQFYAEGVFDDFDLRRVRSVFTEDAGYVWGLSSSCLGECGRVRASAEYHVTGLRYYTHAGYRNGFTVDRMLIGDQLGPRARGAYGTIDVDGHRGSLGFEAAYEDRNGNQYGAASTTPDDSDFHFVLLGSRPAERRWRAMVKTSLGGVTHRYSLSLDAGAERVENLGHAQGTWRTNWLTRLGVQMRPFRGRY